MVRRGESITHLEFDAINKTKALDLDFYQARLPRAFGSSAGLPAKTSVKLEW